MKCLRNVSLGRSGGGGGGWGGTGKCPHFVIARVCNNGSLYQSHDMFSSFRRGTGSCPQLRSQSLIARCTQGSSPLFFNRKYFSVCDWLKAHG